MELDPGRYEIEISKPGYKTWKGAIELAPGKEPSLDITLAEESPPPAAAPVVATPAAQAPASLTPPPAPAPPKKAPEIAGMTAQQEELNALLDQALELERNREFTKALELIDQVLQRNPDSARGYKARGDNFHAMRKYEEALQNYNRAIELDPGYENAYAERGAIYVEMKDIESACYDFWKACALGKCKEIGVAKQKGLCR